MSARLLIWNNVGDWRLGLPPHITRPLASNFSLRIGDILVFREDGVKFVARVHRVIITLEPKVFNTGDTLNLTPQSADVCCFKIEDESID